ncbi:MAG TPA: hypothetical protein PLS10_00540 [Chitinophagales bacterium]|nr:hypothetical protein [Chitinophagales bacterium]
MQKLLLIIGVLALFTSCKNNNTSTATEPNSVVSEIKDAVTGEGLKSAIYETETIMPAGMGTTTTKVTFDDYGKKSRTEMNSAISFGGKSMNTSTNSLMIDGFVYSWQTGAKTGTKFKLDESRFDPNNLDFSKMTEEMRKKMNFKDEGTESVNGKECKVASFSTEQMQGKVWMWKQIPIKMEMSIVGKTVTSTLKNLEENPSLAANIFEVPADIDFKEMNLPATAAK